MFALAGRYRVFNFVFSALRGPSTRPTLAGAPLTDAVAFGPLFPRVRSNLTALRLGAEVRIGLTSSALTSAWLEALCGEIRSGVEDSGRVEHGADTG